MMRLRMLFMLLLGFGVASPLNAQQKSVHFTQKQLYGSGKSLQLQKSNEEIIPLKKVKSDLSLSVFGYLPYWEYPTARYNLRYDLLTHIALFDFSVDSLGNISNPPYWPWTDVINKAHQNGLKVILSATNFESSQMHQLLFSDSAKQLLYENLKTKVELYNLDGVNIDFEEFYSSERGDVLNNFMKEITASLHAAIPDCEVSFAGPSVNWSGWKLAGLADACDYIFIMGYAFAGSWSDVTGSNAPLLGGAYNITNTVASTYGSVVRSNPKKLILGVPYYGNKWKTRSANPHTEVVDYALTTRFRDDVTCAAQYGMVWESSEKTPWYRWNVDDTTWYQVWFDDDSSLGLKYSLAQAYNLKGIGMWALGYDGTRPELWNEIEKRFKISAVEEIMPQPESFSLSQNFPNPFNNSTTVRYTIPENLNGVPVSLKVYSVLGELIDEPVHRFQPPGMYEVHISFPQERSSSGVYYYQLQAGSFLQTKKMLYLK